MDALDRWSLDDLIDCVLREHLVDECILEEEYVVIVQGSTRFVLDHNRAHAFLRGIVRGMSPAFRWKSGDDELSRRGGMHMDLFQERGEESGMFDSLRRHLVKKWWGRYERAGCPFGESVSGLMVWIRYNTAVTTS